MKKNYMYAVVMGIWYPNMLDNYYDEHNSKVISVHFNEENAKRKADALNSRIDAKYKRDFEADAIRGVGYSVVKVLATE